MDLKKLYKQRITDEILTTYGDAWSVLIHDKITADIVNPIFKKSDLLDFNITAIFSIGDNRPKWDLPAIYFVHCTKEIAKTINSEYKAGKYSSIKVFSLCAPQNLDPMVKCTVVRLDVRIIEERIFQCTWDNLSAISSILNAKLSVRHIGCTKDLAQKIKDTLICPRNIEEEASLLVLDRTIDLYTPLMYFFTFRSVLSEVGAVDCIDEYYKEIRNKHIGEVSKYLQYTVLKLQERIKKLDKDNINVDALDTLVLEAPKNIELKKNVEKYGKHLEKCFQKLQEVQDIAESQQNLVLEKDKAGNKARITLDCFMSSIVSPALTTDDRVGLLFLLKVKGIIFTDSEVALLKSRGFSKEDLGIVFNRKNQILRTRDVNFKYDVSRYEPVVRDVVENFVTKQGEFQMIGHEQERIESLRRSTMFSSEKQPRKLVVVFIKNGLSIEEIRLAYSLSESLGVEFLFGSDKVLTRREFVSEYRSNAELHEMALPKK